jgi:hypothetical protein
MIEAGEAMDSLLLMAAAAATVPVMGTEDAADMEVERINSNDGVDPNRVL